MAALTIVKLSVIESVFSPEIHTVTTRTVAAIMINWRVR
jgi:hypothetical protein